MKETFGLGQRSSTSLVIINDSISKTIENHDDGKCDINSVIITTKYKVLYMYYLNRNFYNNALEGLS